ncbi:hypothetical protein KVT40_007032 [Elsinoe batatas]|uniref:Uncharacterized protein n=1 Tax=Elsinoe batatas TaxID=2601811 RepID=A0A8K0L0B5_9PEZI|nr:hypothetical protein KVT40_007032 [Elsinoe batatas]
MKTRAARVFIQSAHKIPEAILAMQMSSEPGGFTPLLPYLNPIWWMPTIILLFKHGIFLYPIYLIKQVVLNPDFLGYYIFKAIAFRPEDLPIDWQHWQKTLFTICFSYIGLIAFSAIGRTRGVARPGRPVEQTDAEADDSPTVEEQAPRMEKFLMPPLLFPAKTTHTRFFPKEHSFAYSYFYVGIPIGWRGRSGTTLSADVDRLPKQQRKYGWFDVNSADYLNRSTKPVSLEAKLRTYLRSEGVKDDDWSFAYLCTAPRFLGYSFNPVSFWYIYGAQSELKMMLLEVNNTFDERRMYLLKADDEVNGKFKKSWTKDFHVSPFNSRKGSYSLQAKNPYHAGKGLETSLDNLITLKSSKNHTKLVARVFSEGPAIDPSTITNWQLFRVIAGWFWVGFMTFPRIIYEAFKLFFARKLHVWYRPEVLATSLGRRTTAEERIIEGCFSKYLKFLVDRSQFPIEVVYHPPGDIGESQRWRSPAANQTEEEVRSLVINVTGPAFYSRMVHYPHLTEAFNREGFCTDEKNRTVLLSKPDVLDMLLAEDSKRPGIKRFNRVEKWQWNVLKYTRCPPFAVSYEEKQTAKSVPGMSIEDIGPPRLSQLDHFVMQRITADEAAEYRTLVTKTFLAQRYALGITPLVSLADYILRVALIVAAYLSTLAAVTCCEATVTALAGSDVWLARDKSNLLIACGGSLLGSQLVHIWSRIKGTAKVYRDSI